MTVRITEIVFDSTDPGNLARFWAAALGWDAKPEREGDIEYWVVGPSGDPAPCILIFQKVAESKTVKNRVHLDVNPVGSNQDEELGRLEALGARRIDVGQGDPSWIVLADPEGNEFCLLQRRLEG